MPWSKTLTTKPRTRSSFFSAILGAFALVAILATPAGAQARTSDQAELQAQEEELTTRISQITNRLADLDLEEDQVEVDIERTRGAIESAADELELLALQRREPALIRANVAIERFVSGDPAGEAFAIEIQALGGSDASSDPLQQQEVLDSVVEAADVDLNRLNNNINTVSSSIPTIRNRRTSLQNRLVEIDSTRDRLSTNRTGVEQELLVVAEGLAWYDNSASRSVLTGRTLEASAARPALAVKIDNVGRARPQSGINEADVVYVELVEGGSTRYAAVFHSSNVGTIGPIRSMRTTDVNLLRPLNSPLFANSGGNQVTTQAVNASSLVNIGHATGAGGAYFRNNNRSAPHNLFSSDSALRGTSSSGGTPPPLFTVRRPGTPNPNGGVATNGVNVFYENTSVSYVWNGSGWDRSQDGAPTVDAANGARTAPETVIVRFTPYGVSAADANSPEAITVGSGTAWIFTEGQLIEGNWSKPNPDAVTAYTDGRGNPIELEPGRVWVEIPTPSGASLR